MLPPKTKSEVFIKRTSKRSLLGNLLASANSTASADEPGDVGGRGGTLSAISIEST